MLKLVRINHFNLYILILISGQYQTLAAETQQQKLICLGDALQVGCDQFDDLALFSFTRLMSFIHRHCDYSVEEVNDIRLNVYIFINWFRSLVFHRSDTESFDSHVVLFILINFSLAAYCFHQ